MILQGDACKNLLKFNSGYFDCCITSPPFYGLRDYGMDGQIGLEKSPEEYVEILVKVFREVRRVLKDDGTFFLNLGDTYNSNTRWGGGGENARAGNSKNVTSDVGNAPQRTGHLLGLKPKDLIGIPWMVAFALRNDGWYLRQDIIWEKSNAMPESVTDRCTKSHEYIFLFSKKEHYYFDHEAIREPSVEFKKVGFRDRTRLNRMDSVTTRKLGLGNQCGVTETRNKRSVWTVNTKSFKGSHFAVFPTELIVPCVLAGCRLGGKILDPFFGSGTVGVVAKKYGRNYVGLELNPEYVKMARMRIANINVGKIMPALDKNKC